MPGLRSVLSSVKKSGNIPMKISDLGFPESFMELFDNNDFSLYPHQEEAILKFRNGNNVLVSVPTASGKTLIAYVAIYEMHRKGLRSMYMVPLRALASEKYRELKKLEALGLKVGISIGDYDASPSFLSRYDVLVCTSEKADSMIRHDPGMLYNIGLIVADEVHLVGDPSRGSRVEMVLSSALHLNPEISIMALSATISNHHDVARWLKAEKIVSDFRPVPLKYGILTKGTLEFNEGETIKLQKGNEVVETVRRSIAGGGQALVFVSSRKKAEQLANALSTFLEIVPENHAMQKDPFAENDRYSDVVNSLIMKGVCFHHAGLSTEQRGKVEKSFIEGSLKVIVATPTLAAGINLPARTVIVRDISRFSDGYSVYLPNMEIQQMLGRAGRPKYDKEGEALVYAGTERALEKAYEYMEGEVEPVNSSLGDLKFLPFNVLALMATGIATNEDSIIGFYSNTLYGVQNEVEDLRLPVEETMTFLEENEFIRKKLGLWQVSTFGKMVSDLYIDPRSAIILRKYFEKSHSEELALYYICRTPDMIPLRYRNGNLPMIEYFMDQAGIEDYEEEAMSAALTAMVLKDWIDEKSMNDITETYDIGPGDLQMRVSSAEWISYSLSRLASIYKPEIRTPLERLNLRIKEGVRDDVIELTTIPGIGRVRARRLYQSGFSSIQAVSAASVDQISGIFGFSDRLSKDTIRYARNLIERSGR